VNGIDVNDCKLVGEKSLARQSQGLGGEGRIAVGIGEDVPHRRDKIRVERCGGLAALMTGNPIEQNFGRDLMAGFPAGEGLGVVHGKKF
jgi:hypothetical protein